ncbi:rhodanese-like domain-containing protein [Anaerobacillus sp. MEB173]|uniref:rhodanese-like domain-containing protein n=1 Tax=Anaerobacillus sp. MEB173 TaxID=3383345 RepID=UPI003F8E1C54
MAYEYDGIKQLDYNELNSILKEKQKAPIIIDVREEEEYNEAHIPTIPLIPMHSIPEQIDKFDKNAEYIFVCRSGNRSHNVAKFFQMNGFSKVANYDGGMLVWEGETKSGPENIVKDASELFKK